MFCLVAVTLEQHIRLANGIGFRVDLLPKKVDRNIFAALCRQCHKPILCNGEHTTRSAGPIIAGVSSVLDLIRNRHKDKVSHQFNNITGRPVFAGFLIVLLVELTDQFLENRTHAVVVQTGMLEDGPFFVFVHRVWAEVDVRRYKFFNDCTEDICLDHGVNLIAELELLQNLLHIRRESVKICFKIRFQGLLFRTAGKVAQTERRCIAKSLSSHVAQCRPLVIDTCRIQLFLHIQDSLFTVLQKSIQTADDRHRQDNVAVLAAHIHIPQAVVCNAPYKANYLIMHPIVHISSFPFAL